MPRGEIAGDVRLLGRSERDRTATYEVLVANDTAAPVAAFAYAVEPGRGPGRITWNAMMVPAFSAVSVEIEIALPRRGRMPRVVAEVHAEDAQLTLDSTPPLARFAPAALRRAATATAACLVTTAALAGFAGSRPHVAALAAPPSVLPGSEVAVAYAFSGASSGEFVVDAPDGMQLRRGTLRGGSGAFTVALPAGPAAGGYDLHVIARSGFGSDERSMHLAALAPPAPSHAPDSPAKIGGLALAADVAVAGTPVVVTYRTAARSGTVRLIDEYGTVRAEALLNRTGTSLLVAPAVDADQDLRVVVTAESGGAHDEAQVPVRVLRAAAPGEAPPAALAADPGQLRVPALTGMPGAPPPADPAAAPASQQAAEAPPAPAPADDASAGGVRQAVAVANGSPIEVARSQAADRPILVRVLRYEPKMHVAVLGNSGEELEGADVSPGDRIVSLSSPRALGTRHPAIVATFENGSEQETVVRAVKVRGT
jgi:hypothetical protein